MKKLLLMVIVAVVSLTANAQVYLGGEVGLWRDAQDGANKTSLSILPEIGYNLDENWAIGTVVGYTYEYNHGTKMNAFKIAPYARYTFLKLDNVNLFLDGGFGFSTYKVSYEGHDSDALNAFEIGVKPGVAVNLTDKLSFVAHTGFLGYREKDKEAASSPFGKNGFGFDLAPNTLSFGLYWNF